MSEIKPAKAGIAVSENIPEAQPRQGRTAAARERAPAQAPRSGNSRERNKPCSCQHAPVRQHYPPSSSEAIGQAKTTNPYESWLAHADMFVVTADSINMTGEACATGKPVYVFEPHGGSAKFLRFHESLRRYGATRKLADSLSQLDNWSYAPLDSASQIAAEIKKRWHKID